MLGRQTCCRRPRESGGEWDGGGLAAFEEKRARLATEAAGTPAAGARAAGAGRFIVQSIAFAYAAGREPHPETDPLNLADPVRAVTVKGAVDMEQQALSASGLDAIVLRYGLLYGPGTWREASSGPEPALHGDAAAHAALLAITQGAAGVYNLADDDGAVSIGKARTDLGFDPRFRRP